jgi:hypothetical protein
LTMTRSCNGRSFMWFAPQWVFGMATLGRAGAAEPGGEIALTRDEC